MPPEYLAADMPSLCSALPLVRFGFFSRDAHETLPHRTDAGYTVLFPRRPCGVIFFIGLLRTKYKSAQLPHY